MIALSGIVTRDSIILVDFIHLSLGRGRTLFDAIMESRVVRLRPILLTAGAAMLGAVPIIIDPIFSGLAWSLIFGLFASTLFTLFVIPVVYWMLYAHKPGHGLSQSTMDQEDATEEAPRGAGRRGVEFAKSAHFIGRDRRMPWRQLQSNVTRGPTRTSPDPGSFACCHD